MLDPTFLEAVKSLLSPWTGTGLMAPLLYTLARFTRSRTVLEGGSGYTTPFLAKALADNARAVEEERRAMREKTARDVAHLDAFRRLRPLKVTCEGTVLFEGPVARTFWAMLVSIAPRNDPAQWYEGHVTVKVPRKYWWDLWDDDPYPPGKK